MNKYIVERRAVSFSLKDKWTLLQEFRELETAKQFVLTYKATHEGEFLRIIQVIVSEFATL